jgi:hypothetical protein
MNNYTRCNGAVYFYGLGQPNQPIVLWVDDHAVINSNNGYNSEVIFESWESINGLDYFLASESLLGQNIFNSYSFQNVTVRYKIRARTYDGVSDFSEPVTLKTPLVFKYDQSILSALTIKTLNISAGKTVNIDWGDGLNNNYVGNNAMIVKNYGAVQNPYFIAISGDVDDIADIEYLTDVKAYGDISKWLLPANIGLFHFYGHSFTGDLTNWDISKYLFLGVFHIGNNSFTGYLSEWNFINNLYDLHLENNFFTGDISNWQFATRIGHISIANNNFTGNISKWILPTICLQGGAIGLQNNNLTGDLSGWIPQPRTQGLLLNNITAAPTNFFTGDLTAWVMPIDLTPYDAFDWNLSKQNFIGDLSAWIIPDNTVNASTFRAASCNFTKFPRGFLRGLSVYNFSENNCDAAEIESFLHDVDTYFAGGVVPLRNCIYTLDGVSMGIANAAALAHKLSIENKYIAAGFIATITVN